MSAAVDAPRSHSDFAFTTDQSMLTNNDLATPSYLELEAHAYLTSKAAPVIVEFLKTLLKSRHDDVLTAMHEFTVAKLKERTVPDDQIPHVDKAVDDEDNTENILFSGDEGAWNKCGDDEVSYVDNPGISNAVSGSATPCALCLHMMEYAEQVNFQMLHCSYCILSLERQPPWRLEKAVLAAKKTVTRCCKTVVLLRKQLDQEKTKAAGGWVTRSRGGDSSSKSSESSEGLPDIMASAPVNWRRGWRQSVCAESMRDMIGFELPHYRKDAQEREMLEKCLSGSGCFMFAAITDKSERTKLIDAMKPMSVAAGTVLIHQGDSGDGMYFVSSGTLKVERDGCSGRQFLREVGPGDCIGELAVLYRAKRSSNVTAIDNCKVWFLDRQSFNLLAREAATKKRERFERFLKSVPILQKVGMFARGRIADALQECTFKAKEIVVHEGEVEAKAFYIIVDGTATVSKAAEDFTPATLGPGSYFGEVAILKQCPRQATVTADTELRVAQFEHRAFKAVMSDIIPLLTRGMEAYA